MPKIKGKIEQFDFEGLKLGLRFSDQEVTGSILQTMLESFKNTICEECQSNRVVCILRPRCTSRHFQDLLISANYKPNNVPAFCYSVRLKEVFENYQKKIRLTHDTSLFLSDFHRIFSSGNKKPKFNPKIEFEKLLQSYNIENYIKFETDFYIVAFNRNLLFVDLQREIININPDSWRLMDSKLVEAVIEVYAKEYGFQVTVEEEYDFFLVVNFNFGKTQLDPDLVDLVLKNSDYLMGFDPETNELMGEIHFPKHSGVRVGEEGLILSRIRELFEHLSSSLIGATRTSTISSISKT